ncbi:vitamin K epoxide reductase family protein [Wenzhouxiangella limi]|uniref:Vitamin K epoxide reductase family protein n=1 Tax=Wenzhouxiangella limi TaxID=2707351 RepID=A0A845V1D8_9GAMM|nr:vitamin K epoxide reductase family protein [Wenzhouxiangella limi]NDY96544.1 vitamin K epoxide reductase family protein [Wenzhouxiangella limi]
MSKRKKRPVTASETPRKRVRFQPDWSLVGLAAGGMLVTGYLTLARSMSASPLLCGEGSSCELVQQSHWSVLLGLPVSLWGFGLYALIALIAGLGRPRLKRWRRLWLLAFFGTVFSVYLTLAGWLALQAFCLWCLVSLGIIGAIFMVLSLRRPESAPGMPWAGFLAGQGAMVGVMLVLLHALYAGWFQAPEDPRLRALAEHLERTGAVYYGASWCPSCQQQSQRFGQSADRLPYVECSPQGRGGGVAFECVSNDITSYPTWVIGNRRFEQLLEPEELARRSRFDWDGWREETQAGGGG